MVKQLAAVAIVVASILGLAPLWAPVGGSPLFGVMVAILLPVAAASAVLSRKWYLSLPIKVVLVVLAAALAGTKYEAEQAAVRVRAEAAHAEAVAVQAEEIARQTTIRDQAVVVRNAAIAAAEAQIAEGFRRMIPAWRAEGRAALAQARSLPVPQVVTPALMIKPHQGFRPMVVVAPVACDLSLSLLIELIAAAWAMWFLAVPAVVTEVAPVAVETHKTCQGVDARQLDDAARQGLDIVAGAWRGAELAAPKLRKGVLWPTLAGQKRTVFIGSVPALRAVGAPVPTKNVVALRKVA